MSTRGTSSIATLPWAGRRDDPLDSLCERPKRFNSGLTSAQLAFVGPSGSIQRPCGKVTPNGHVPSSRVRASPTSTARVGSERRATCQASRCSARTAPMSREYYVSVKKGLTKRVADERPLADAHFSLTSPSCNSCPYPGQREESVILRPVEAPLRVVRPDFPLGGTGRTRCTVSLTASASYISWVSQVWSADSAGGGRRSAYPPCAGERAAGEEGLMLHTSTLRYRLRSMERQDYDERRLVTSMLTYPSQASRRALRSPGYPGPRTTSGSDRGRVRCWRCWGRRLGGGGDRTRRQPSRVQTRPCPPSCSPEEAERLRCSACGGTVVTMTCWRPDVRLRKSHGDSPWRFAAAPGSRPADTI